MAIPGAEPNAYYMYPALGSTALDGPPAPPQRTIAPAQPPASAAPRPEPAAEARAVADAIVRSALRRGPGGPARSVFQPGVIPLRPLSFSEIYNGAVAVMRFDPRAVLGFAVVLFGFGALIQTAALAPALRWGLRVAGIFGSKFLSDSLDGASGFSLVGRLAEAPVSALAAPLLAGWVMLVLSRALVPDSGAGEEPPSLWREARGRALPLAGLALLLLAVQTLIVLVPVATALALVAAGLPLPAIMLLLVFGVPFFLMIAFVVSVLLSLAAPAMASERLGVLAACSRSVRLARRGFWKMFGLSLLTKILTSLVGFSLSLPFLIAGGMFDSAKANAESSALWGVLLVLLGQLLSRSILEPFAASVTALLYVDQRMRQEAYDLVLLSGGLVEAEPGEEQ